MKKERVDESREVLLKVFYFALGSYMEQESKKVDSWQEHSVGQLYAHLKHELEEIKTNLSRQELSFLLHNCVDAVSLSTMLLAKVMQMSDILEDKK